MILTKRACLFQVSLPEIDGAIEPIIYAGREGATGRSVPLADRVQLVADRALKVCVVNFVLQGCLCKRPVRQNLCSTCKTFSTRLNSSLFA